MRGRKPKKTKAKGPCNLSTHPRPTCLRHTAPLSPNNFQVSEIDHISRRNHGLNARNKRRKRERHTQSLPRDIMHRILLLLPAEVLQDVIRYVCKDWCSIVDDSGFHHAQGQEASKNVVIIINDRVDQQLALFVETNSSTLKLRQMRLPFPATISGSCNGLVLLHEYQIKGAFHVVNLITKVIVSLPPLIGIESLSVYNGHRTALSHTSSGHYKVVHVYQLQSELQIMVFTVGVDKVWRVIDLDIPRTKYTKYALLMFPFSISGFIYWLDCKHSFGLALDVDAEKLYRFSNPEDYDFASDCRYYANCMYVETTLGFVGYCHQTRGWVIWELTDLKASKWTKVIGIDEVALRSTLRKEFNSFDQACPGQFRVLRDGEVWFSCNLYQKSGMYLRRKDVALVCYNLRKEILLVCPTDRIEGRASIPSLHINTLLSSEDY